MAHWQREFGDTVHLRIWPEHMVVLAEPQLVRELLVARHDALVRWERGIAVMARTHGHSVLMAEGEAWRAKRQALQPAFAPKAVQAFVPAMGDAVARALDGWPHEAARWPIEQALTALTMDVIMRLLFSSTVGDDARTAETAVHALSRAANTAFYWPASISEWLPGQARARRARQALESLIDRHLTARLALPDADWPDDLLTRLLRLHRSEPQAWPLQAVRDECMTAFLAGHETTAATLTWWAWCMAAHPEIQTAARAEVAQVLQGRRPEAADLPALRLLTATLQETLRRYPAVPVLMSRRGREPVTLGGRTYPARTLFVLPVQLLHHDARWFEQPLAFRPARFLDGAPEIPRGAYLPFGAGPRVCLGQHLALTEMVVVAAMLLQRATLTVPAGMAAPEPVVNVTLRPREPLVLAVGPA
ncbi:MAG: cytochrome P450 [Proteobacteria bacterium]|nr:cytochrome P450 [Pseudomonadota bacterium]